MFILCLKIFFVRILDVSLGTIRTMITVKGKALLASLVGFFEIFVWFVIVREALNTDNTSIWIAISYSLGFMTGTYIGSKLSEKFIKGNLSVQVITENINLISKLRDDGYAVSVLNIKGKNENDKYMLLIEINNTSFDHLKDNIKKIDNKAFIVVHDTKYVQNGYIK